MEKKIVLLHGWEARAAKLEPLARELQRLGWKVINLEMPGFGLSAPEFAWGVGEYADWVRSKVKGKYVVFGHSFGGRIAIKLAAQGGVKGVVLCAPGGLSRPGKMKRVLFEVLAKVGKVLSLERYKAVLYKLAREHDYERTDGVMREVFKKVVDEDLRPDVMKIRIPTLVLWGKEDKIVHVSDGKWTEEQIGAKLVLFDGQGHKLPYELPERVAKEIDVWFGLL
ncbi:MAG: Hydrolase, alpha/beta domain protein [Microgenomates group bacterium GW2011_GWB1_44_8]|nr:MAG: Hydrolase, alpha/beta domain protein [Microgenomates group bacterium GW2011_GWB1_44_8]